jgi:hypothetical protein
MVLVPQAALILLLLAIPAQAQEDHPDWIPANPDYRTKGGQHCCSIDHCRTMLPGEVVRIKGGWFHQPTQTFLMDGEVGVYDSEEPKMYGCVWGGRLQCIFPAVAF